MKIKTRELTGLNLDWAVAKCEGREKALEINRMGSLSFDAGIHPYMADLDKPGRYQIYSPSTKWEQGGLIIERVEIAILTCPRGWAARIGFGGRYLEGPTPLIAAMRCYVTNKLGDEEDEITIPEELV